MYVEQTFRGLRLNGFILEALKRWVNLKGIKKLRLQIYGSNTAAIKACEMRIFALPDGNADGFE